MDRAQMYHDMTTAELHQKYADLKNELFNLRFQQTTGQLKNPLLLRTVKKDIARVITILRERELALPRNKGRIGAIAERKSLVQKAKDVEIKPAAPKSKVKPTTAKEAKK